MKQDLFDRLGTPERIREIAGYDLFDPDLRTSLDAIAQRTAGLLEASVSLVSVVLDMSQFILGSHGVAGWVADAQGVPAEWALCTNTVLGAAPYRVSDGATDPRHADNPLLQMTGLRSYFGVPLIGRGGHALGSHCVIDDRPRIFSDVDLAVLNDGAEKSMKLLEAYRLR
ncbi:GAF domain-containing protein [Actinoplanes sp. NPDC023801]|uniref:GAF domain-containing protein n=1 Tax=Actinoplanes sp. NPDC023801 TaxID=3154595 RepID=UPI0033ECFC7D